MQFLLTVASTCQSLFWPLGWLTDDCGLVISLSVKIDRRVGCTLFGAAVSGAVCKKAGYLLQLVVADNHYSKCLEPSHQPRHILHEMEQRFHIHVPVFKLSEYAADVFQSSKFGPSRAA